MLDKIKLSIDYVNEIKNLKSDGLYLIVDIGGTKTLIRILENLESVLFEKRFETKELDSSNPKEFVTKILFETKKLAPKMSLKVISVSTPGVVDNHGKIIYAPNLQWKNLELKEIFERVFKTPTILLNDCNAGVLSEKFFDPGMDNLMYITISSGIGGGLVLDNKLFFGDNFSSAEIGHLVVVPEGKLCVCGNKGCIQEYCSGKGLYREFKKYFPYSENELEILSEVFNSDNSFIQKELEDSFKKLAQLLSIFSGLLDLNNFRLGGGLMIYSKKILGILNKWTNYYQANRNKEMRIEKAKSYPHSSVKGAEIFAKIYEYEKQFNVNI
jgi:predicted NBD/HSP70 family sugar kinase